MTLKHVVEDVDRHGNVRIYVRRRGFGKVRLHATPGTDAFLTEYRAAVGGLKPLSNAPPATQGTWKWLSALYLASPEYAALSKSTRGMRRLHLDRIGAKHGDNPVKLMRPKHVRRILSDFAAVPNAANNTLKTIRVVFKWAIDNEYMDHNPARDVARYKVSGDGYHTWTADEIRRFMKRHPLDTKAGFACALLFLTRARRSDVVKLGRQMESSDGQWLTFSEVKGRDHQLKTTEVFITDEFRAILDNHKGPHLAYLVTEHGQPFRTGNSFANWFKDRCVEAGLQHCSCHGLRKAGASIAAEEGATEFDIMALLGHTSPNEAKRYTRKARRRVMAERGAKLVRLGDQK